ncbi:flagellar export protein FliJ [Paenibacillus chartarius]|uniref:Flagellar FliJ protein n=1 Tax=Paenibacillus chartarius TaxID=747481 RepID=A0ABV6DP31_9BACL
MKFRYAFQQIVDLKNNERTQAEWVLSEAIGVLRTEQTMLDTLEAEKQRLQQELAGTTERVTTISHMQGMQHYVNHLHRQIEKKHVDVRQAKQHVEQKQQLLTDRMVDEKVWTKARDKAFRLHTALTLKKEQEALDEMASVRYLRSSPQV